ncbi:helix-turn-helix domain-containing protein [Brevibacillus reuszeri]|uniref:helix-turn-helix domain-containing protein n=1 Tax=Brevibacillus TaxID=55080 RepID=UPI000CCC5923|nr:helix-turn-helix transcriptional regulator [Brevibacillus reuszeri]
MTELIKRLGNRIRFLRKVKGLSQEQLGELSGLHTNYIGQVERGEKNVTVESLEKIAKGLDVTLEELFRHIDPSPQADELQQLLDLLAERSTQDRELALQLVKSVFKWEKEKYQ